MRTHADRGLRLALAVLITCTAAAARARADDGLTVQPAKVSTGIFFNGTRVILHGTVGSLSQVAVRLMGPPDHQVYNRRGKIAGLIWGGVEHVSFEGAPGIYDLYTSAALSSIADAGTRRKLMLGYDALLEQVRVRGSSVDEKTVADYLRHLKEREGLYRIQPGAVQFEDATDGRRAFHVVIELPAKVPPGVFEISVMEFVHGGLVGTQTAHVALERAGLPAQLYHLAHTHSFLFGLLAVAVSLVTGLGTGMVARRRPARRPRYAAAGEGAAAPEHGAEAAPVIPAVLHSLRMAFSAHPFGPTRIGGVEDLRAKYNIFRDLLSVNNEVLALLAELEEESSWTSFRQPRVRMGIRALFDGTADMVGLLNQLTGDRYFDLGNVVTGIRRDVMDFLTKIEQHEDPRLTLQLKEITSATEGRVGGKAVNLARLECDLGLPVPAAFVITTDAYREFIDSEGLGGELRTVLAPARLDSPNDFQRRCELAQNLIDQAEVPPAILTAIDRAWASSGMDDKELAALRSSASGEDSELSFAGQFDTVLNVPRSGVPDAWKRVVRSRFSPRAVFYRRAAGLAEVDTPMAVLVQRMVRSRASGVLYTRRPDDPKDPVLLVTSVMGLGPEASVGIANADELVVTRRGPRHIVERRVARKTERLVSAEGGGTVRQTVAPEEQAVAAISDEEALALAEKALAIEHYFGRPQDIEWTIDTTGDLYLLQSRMLRTERPPASGVEVPTDAALLLRGGQPVWTGSAVGPVFVAETREDEDGIPEGAILVTAQLLPDCVRFLPRICGVIAERGTVTSHAASLVREFRVPSLFGVTGAKEKLVPGQQVSLHVATRSVFAGALWPELRGQLPLKLLGRQTLGLPSVLAGKLTKLSGSSFMSSWACQSLHDVIRFAHEAAILAMFDIGDSLLVSETGVKKLECPPPLYAHVLDLGGGLRQQAAAKRTVGIDDVVCLPFRALFSGLIDARMDEARPEIPPPRYFASVMTSTVTSEGGRRLGVPNYACITDTYVNLNSRQAYHFAIVDAFLGPNQNNNHVSMRLKGGGAAPWQRALRAQFMADVLRLHHFTTSITGDILNAWLRGIDEQTGVADLEMIGRLLRFSAQLDLWMVDEARVKEYVAAFVQSEAESLASRGDRART